MTDSTEELQDAPAVVVNAPDQIWLTFGDMSEFNGGTVEYADAFRASDVSWCAEQIEASDMKYIRADLVNQRQQQPASVPAELVEQWIKDSHSKCAGETMEESANKFAHYIAGRAWTAAYGRGQSQTVSESQKALMVIASGECFCRDSDHRGDDCNPTCKVWEARSALSYARDSFSECLRHLDKHPDPQPLPEPPTC